MPRMPRMSAPDECNEVGDFTAEIAPDECNEVGDFTAEIVPCFVCMRFF